MGREGLQASGGAIEPAVGREGHVVLGFGQDAQRQEKRPLRIPGASGDAPSGAVQRKRRQVVLPGLEGGERASVLPHLHPPMRLIAAFVQEKPGTPATRDRFPVPRSSVKMALALPRSSRLGTGEKARGV